MALAQHVSYDATWDEFATFHLSFKLSHIHIHSVARQQFLLFEMDGYHYVESDRERERERERDPFNSVQITYWNTNWSM